MNIKKFAKIGTSFLLGAAILCQPFTGVAMAAEAYKLNNSVNAYYTSDDAKARTDSRSVYQAGNYYIYKSYNGMLNISKQTSTAGAWINPNDNKAPVSETGDEIVKTAVGIYNKTDKTFTVAVKTYGYLNAYNAKEGISNVSILYPGTYYVYKTYNGMLNISKTKGSAGSWMNPYTEKTVAPTIPDTDSKPETNVESPKLYTLSRFKWLGVINWNGYKYTWYSQKVLPGPGLRIPGRHVNKDGYVADENGYIVLANSAPNGTVFPTPFGYLGKVYDKGTYGNHLDVYVD